MLGSNLRSNLFASRCRWPSSEDGDGSSLNTASCSPITNVSLPSSDHRRFFGDSGFSSSSSSWLASEQLLSITSSVSSFKSMSLLMSESSSASAVNGSSAFTSRVLLSLLFRASEMSTWSSLGQAGGAMGEAGRECCCCS